MEKPKKWIQKAINPEHKGQLRKELHAKKGKKIPLKKLDKAAHSKNLHVARQANMAKTLRGLRK